ncbi:MAG: hypothetical protein JOY98_03625 [Candidatus Eremiobacteraeota bacterium]|nr:hypothetical protein [Candidatus Eremiobacteraeota bacterium]
MSRAKHRKRPKLVHCAAVLLGALALLAAAPSSYHVTYGGKDLGTWDTMAQGKSASGTYDGATFDSNTGPGFATITLTRPLDPKDRASLFKSLPAPDGPLAVTAAAGKTLTCAKSLVSDFHSNGDPPSGTETIVFACAAPPQ